MTTETVTTEKVSGVVEATNENPSQGYWQVIVNDSWYNANGSLPDDIEENKEVELEVNMDDSDFIDIEDWELADNSSDKSGGGVPPVGRTSNGDPIWLNKSSEGKPFLKNSESEEAIFLNNRLLKDAALRELELREKENQTGGGE